MEATAAALHDPGDYIGAAGPPGSPPVAAMPLVERALP
jgi:hypothetical protein